jgi:phage baseplate assembly protein W
MIKTPKFPIMFNENKGFLNTSSTKEVIKFHIINLFLTNPGEKISDGNYGIGLRRYLFELGSAGIEGEIQASVLFQINKYMPYIKVENSNVIFLEEKNTLSVSLRYMILETSERDILTFEVETTQMSNLQY